MAARSESPVFIGILAHSTPPLPNLRFNADANSWACLRHFIAQLLVPCGPSGLRRRLTWES
jgi:hypothetical protein